MDSEARLARALRAATPPERDPAFTLAILRQAEAHRFRKEMVRRTLRGAALAAASAALLAPSAGWAVANAEALQDGVLAAAGLLTLAGGALAVARRAATAWAG